MRDRCSADPKQETDWISRNVSCDDCLEEALEASGVHGVELGVCLVGICDLRGDNTPNQLSAQRWAATTYAEQLYERRGRSYGCPVAEVV